MLEQLEAQLGRVLAGIWIALISLIMALGERIITAELLKLAGAEDMAELVLILLTTVVVLALYVWVLRARLARKANPNHYELVEDPGYFRHRKRGGKFCPKCLIGGVESPLGLSPNGALVCHSCGLKLLPKHSFDAAFEHYAAGHDKT